MKNHLRPDDYSSRLHHTVVMFNNYPVFVTVDDTDQFTLSPVWSGSKFQPKRIHPDDPGLDISTCPLGYFSGRHGDYTVAYYIERTTPRRWKQGLALENVNITVIDKNRHVGLMRGGVSFHCEGFEQMVLGDYPPLDQVFKRMTSASVQSLAVNREIALSKNDGIFTVFYKQDEVGWIKPGSNKVKLPSEPNTWVIAAAGRKALKELNWEIG